MLVKTALVALIGLAAAAEATSIHRVPVSDRLTRRQNRGGKGTAGNAGTGTNTNTGGNAGAAASCLAANALQTGSASTGQNSAVAADGQVNSLTDTANFINFCAGKTLTNGLQVKTGSCNGIVMGDIPATTKMVSTVIINPKNLDTLPALQTFNITVNIANMALGSFTNATSTYYSAPQQLDGQGRIIGHTHVTVQDVGASLNPTQPLDGSTFVFFKGINDAGNGQGLLTTAVTGGLPAGNYRVCSMAGASNHQPVLMAVAQRGAQDDCRYFSVTGSGAGGNNAGSGTNNAATGSDAGTGAAASSSTSAAAAASTSAAAAAGGKGTGRGGKGKGGAAGGAAGASSVSTSAAAATTSAAASSSAAATTSAAAAAGGKGAGRGGKGKGGAGAASASTSAAAAAAATSSAATAPGGTNNAASGGAAIAGIAAPAVTDSGDATRPFEVNGDTFVNKSAAVQRACAIQNNLCANAVNSGQAAGSTVGDCNAQETACNAAGGA